MSELASLPAASSLDPGKKRFHAEMEKNEKEGKLTEKFVG